MGWVGAGVPRLGVAGLWRWRVSPGVSRGSPVVGEVEGWPPQVPPDPLGHNGLPAPQGAYPHAGTSTGLSCG